MDRKEWVVVRAGQMYNRIDSSGGWMQSRNGTEITFEADELKIELAIDVLTMDIP